MGNIIKGALILLALILIEVVAAFIVTGTTTQRTVAGCTTTQNQTTCGSAGATSFFDSMLSVSTQGINGAPDPVNPIYLTVTGFMLVLGIILLVVGIIGIPFGGA